MHNMWPTYTFAATCDIPFFIDSEGSTLYYLIRKMTMILNLIILDLNLFNGPSVLCSILYS